MSRKPIELLEPPEADYIEDCDAVNDETFGDDHDEWDWEASAEDTESLDSSRSNGHHSSVLHSSNLNKSNFPHGFDVSSIRRLSDIEASFSSISMNDRTASSPSTTNTALVSSISLSGNDDDPAMMFSSTANRFSSSSLLGNSVWAPPDASLFGVTASTGLIPSSSRGPVAPPPPPADPWSSPLPAPKHTLTLEELEASLLNDSPKDSTSLPSQTTSSWSQSYDSNLSVMNRSMLINNSEARDSSVWNPSTPLRPAAAKTLEEIEQEMLAGPSSPVVPPKLKAKTLEEIEREMLSSPQPVTPAVVVRNNTSAPVSTTGRNVKKPTSPLPSPPTAPSFAAVVNAKSQAEKPTVNQSVASSDRKPQQQHPKSSAPQMVMNPSAFPPLNARHPLPGQVLPPMIPMNPGLPRVPMIPLPMPVRPMIIHPHLMPMNIQQRFLVLQQTAYRPPHMRMPGFMDPRMQSQMRQLQLGMRPQIMPRPGFDRNRFPTQNRYQDPQRQFHQRPIEDESANSDEYAGLMSLREREWLIKVQKLQLEGSFTDPYVEDYYAMCYNSKKLQETRAKDKKDAPTLVMLDRASKGRQLDSEDNNNKGYVVQQYAGSLGKLQAMDLKRPRKLLDVNKMSESNEAPEDTPLARKELTQLRKLLLEIERLYTVLLNIDYEDKKMAGLPDNARDSCREKRKQLCQQLFKGITQEDSTGVHVNLNIASIRKGCGLIIRSLEMLQDKRHKSLIISDLKHNDQLQQQIAKHSADQALYGLDFERILNEAQNCLKEP